MIEVQDLTKSYGQVKAVDDISFTVNQGEILGFLGPNGAGKTTTMRILTGYMPATSGTARVAGFDVFRDSMEVRRRIGYLPENPPVYPDMTVETYLDFVARIKHVPAERRKGRIDDALRKTNLEDRRSELIKRLSRGYKQRVGIAQAIIHKPKLVVMDEPTNGLDPNQITEVRTLIKEIAVEHAVIFSSHVLSEVQMLCKEIKMIADGRIVFSDTMDAFNNYVEPHSVLMQMENPPVTAELLRIPGVDKVDFVTERQARVYFTGDREITERLIAASVHNGWRLSEISLDKTALDEIFKQLSTKTTQS